MPPNQEIRTYYPSEGDFEYACVDDSTTAWFQKVLELLDFVIVTCQTYATYQTDAYHIPLSVIDLTEIRNDFQNYFVNAQSSLEYPKTTYGYIFPPMPNRIQYAQYFFNLLQKIKGGISVERPLYSMTSTIITLRRDSTNTIDPSPA